MEKSDEILKKFDLAPSRDFHVFGGDCIEAYSLIEKGYRKSKYDHRILLPPLKDNDTSLAVQTEQYRLGYACFKREVARVLNPESVLEIGIGTGIAALAFMSAVPGAHYIGIDNNHDYLSDFLVKPTAFVGQMMDECGYKNMIIESDSQTVGEFPLADFVHIDGDHRREAVRNDFTKAWNAGPRWILCDDARDSEVVAGIFDSLNKDLNRGSVDWAYFPDTWTGNILIRTDHRRNQ